MVVGGYQYGRNEDEINSDIDSKDSVAKKDMVMIIIAIKLSQK